MGRVRVIGAWCSMRCGSHANCAGSWVSWTGAGRRSGRRWVSGPRPAL